MNSRLSHAAARFPSVSRWFVLLGGRTRAAFSERLDRVPWYWMALWTAIYFLGVLGWGKATGFLEWRGSTLPPGTLVRTCLILILFPGVAEELVFRVWLLPHPSESPSRASRFRGLAASTAIFALWHVINAWLFFPVARPVFWDWRFLVITAWLGWVCGRVYLRSGSIWAPVAIHWLTVVIWKACCAGPVFFE